MNVRQVSHIFFAFLLIISQKRAGAKATSLRLPTLKFSMTEVELGIEPNNPILSLLDSIRERRLNLIFWGCVWA